MDNVACILEGEESSNCWQLVDQNYLNNTNDTYNTSSVGSYYDNENLMQLQATKSNDQQNTLAVSGGGNYSQNLIDSFESGSCGYTKFF